MAGGMWNIAYDYVRLHQPHPMFTGGQPEMELAQTPEYLAARNEVRDHLVGALAPIRESTSLTTGFGTTVSRCEEIETETGPMAEIAYFPNGNEKPCKRCVRNAPFMRRA